MRWLLIFLLFLAQSASAQLGTLPYSGAAAGTNFNSQLKVGAGGFINKIDFASDGTLVGCSDTYGAYGWNPNISSPGNAGGTGAWQQLVSSGSISSYAATAPITAANSDYSCYDIRIAPSNSSIFYLSWNALIWKSTNKGASWSQTGFSTVPMQGANQANEQVGPYIAIDPSNANVVYVGTTSGVFKTTDGGPTWNTVSGVGTAGSVGSLIAIDTSGGTSSPGGVLQNNNVYVATSGTGVYASTNAGAAFTLTTSGPTAVGHLTVSPTGGLVNATDFTSNTNTFHQYSGGLAGTWSTKTVGTGMGHVAAIAYDPANASNIVATNGFGQNSMTVNGGTSWSAATALNVTITATDIPWLQNGQANVTLTSTDLRFDPSQSNVVYLAAGVGVFKISPTTGTTALSWLSQSAGIENMVANWIISPPGGNLMTLYLDRPVFTHTDQTKFPTQYGPSYATAAGGIKDGWKADWASNSSSFVATIAQQVSGNADYSGFVTNNQIGSGTDGGPSNWTIFSGHSQITDITVFGGSKYGGAIAAASSTNIVWAMSNDNSGGNTHVWVTTDGGANWAIPGTLPVGGWGNAPFSDNRQIVIADRDPGSVGTFYAYNSDNTGTPGVYKSTNSGSTWSLVSSGQFDSGNVNNSKFNSHMRAVSNIGSVSVAGHSFYTSGPTTGTPFPFYRTSNGWSTRGTVPNVTGVTSFGFGLPQAGNTYPAIYIYGIVSGVSVISGGTSGSYGIWRSDDGQNASPTWTQLSNAFPGNSFDRVTVIEGDNNKYGTVYVGFGGSSVIIGKLNFLFNRDLNPANDNTPMWLNAVA